MSKGKLQEASKNLKAIVEKTNGLTDLEAKTNEVSLERSKELHGVLENDIGRRNVDKTRICKTGKKLYEKITENYEEAQLKDREKIIYIRAASREEKVRNYDYAAELLRKAGLENEVKEMYTRAASREEKVGNYDYAAELLKKACLENEVKNYK